MIVAESSGIRFMGGTEHWNAEERKKQRGRWRLREIKDEGVSKEYNVIETKAGSCRHNANT